jgi:hypothetical protein
MVYLSLLTPTSSFILLPSSFIKTEITEVIRILSGQSPFPLFPPVKLLSSTFSEFLLSFQNSQNTFLESDFLDLYSVSHVNKQV